MCLLESFGWNDLIESICISQTQTCIPHVSGHLTLYVLRCQHTLNYTTCET